jgi:hypothetical protein
VHDGERSGVARRVDNRRELLAFLKTRGHVIRNETDAELVLAAYNCWGDDSPGRIVGDFAFAIWDERRQRLLWSEIVSDTEVQRGGDCSRFPRCQAASPHRSKYAIFAGGMRCGRDAPTP